MEGRDGDKEVDILLLRFGPGDSEEGHDFNLKDGFRRPDGREGVCRLFRVIVYQERMYLLLGFESWVTV